MDKLTIDKASTIHKNRKIQIEKQRYVPPVYPVVDIPVPELGLNKIRGKKNPWYLCLLPYFISKVITK